MRYYCAPMEGITGHIFRTVHHRHFPGVDSYYMPFVSPTQDHVFSKRDFKDILPEQNKGLNAVPQLLTRKAEDFLWAAGRLAGMGYGEVNLNLGCPSGTVVAKGKGSGFLSAPAELDRFLDEIFSAATVHISVKTRLGRTDPAEFERLLDIYNQYPISQLIIHPRVQKDFYQNSARAEVFAAALPRARMPVCYNGDLVTAAELLSLPARFPGTASAMAGRGLLADPALFLKAQGGPGADRAALRAFHDELYHSYCTAFGSDRNAMLRMKELWRYLICRFGNHEDYGKRLRKARDSREYESLAAGIFRELPLLEDTVPGW